MGSELYHTTTDGIPPRCPHSDGPRIPICWDCTEKGHVGKDKAASPPASPTWIKMNDRLKRSLVALDGRRSFGSLKLRSDSAFDVHPPEPSIKVSGVSHARKSQPGLEVSAGPTIVTGEERERVLRGEVSLDEKRSSVAKSSPERGKICGVRRKVFLIVVGVVILVGIATMLGSILGLREAR